MNPSLFSQAVDEAFPLLNETTRDEIKMRVFFHMIEFLKEKVYVNDAEGLKILEQRIHVESVAEKQHEIYLTQIIEKFNSLPSNEKSKLTSELYSELTRVMQEIYKAYE